ncbi:MAG: MmgE/PrpD family protein [Gaiellaceae bacterium]
MVTRRHPVAAELVEWALALEPMDVPDALLEQLKLRLLDTAGLILVAWELPDSAAVRTVFERQGGEAEARLLVEGALPAASAGAVHGALAHALDYDDTLLDSLLHVSSVVFPTVLAVGEAADVSGLEALTTAAAAYEVAARLGSAAGRGFHERGFHATGVLGPLFAAVAAARLHNLEPAAAVAAVGIAGSMGSGLLEFLSDGSSTKRLHPGWAAHGGILAAELAGAGFSGPASVVEGRFGVFGAYLGGIEAGDARKITAGLGRSWLASAGAFKLYPCAHVLHGYIDAALSLRTASDAPLTKIVASMPELEVELFARPLGTKVAPRSEYESRASLPYTLAAAFLDGAVGPETFVGPAYERPQAIRLAGTVEVVPGEDRSLELSFADGTTVRADVDAAATSATRAAVLDKFERNAAALLAPEVVEGLRDTILTLEQRRLREVVDRARAADGSTRA